MILGLIDLEANYLVVKAYQYTTLTSIQVLATLLFFAAASVSRCSFLSAESPGNLNTPLEVLQEENWVYKK